MEMAEAALERLCDPAAEVSAHYLIGCDGTLYQLVDEAQRAWHAGAGTWCGQDDINSRSIGIELDNPGDCPFSQPQMVCLEGLLPAIMARWDIPPGGVIGHSDMAPERKFDPGARFDWPRLARAGLAAPAPAGAPATPDLVRFRHGATAMGYPAEVSDEALLRAVRLRFRPWGRGRLTAEDMALVTRFI